MAQTVPTWTKGRGLLTEFVTSLGHGSDRFASLCLHTLTRTRETSCRTNCCCKKKKGPESWVKHAKPYDPTFVSSHLPGCNSGSEHLPCVWEELCSVYLFNRANHSTFSPVQARVYQTAGTRACLCATALSKPGSLPKHQGKPRACGKRALKRMDRFPL